MFRFRLALALGYRTVAELERTMTTREFAEWQAFERLEPFGDAAANWRAAMLAQLTANIHRNPKKQKAFALRDWLPQTSLTIKEAHADLSSRLLGAFKSRPKDDDRKGT